MKGQKKVISEYKSELAIFIYSKLYTNTLKLYSYQKNTHRPETPELLTVHWT